MNVIAVTCPRKSSAVNGRPADVVSENAGSVSPFFSRRGACVAPTPAFSAPAIVPGSSDPAGGLNGSHQGLLMRKLGVKRAGDIAVVNSSLKHHEKSRVWLMRGQLRQR